MRCLCGHYNDNHRYDEETHGHYECLQCDCEAFERSVLEEYQHELDELEGDKDHE